MLPRKARQPKKASGGGAIDRQGPELEFRATKSFRRQFEHHNNSFNTFDITS